MAVLICLSISIRANESGRCKKLPVTFSKFIKCCEDFRAFTDEIVVPWCGFNTPQTEALIMLLCLMYQNVVDFYIFCAAFEYHFCLFTPVHRLLACCVLINNVHFHLLIAATLFCTRTSKFRRLFRWWREEIERPAERGEKAKRDE